MATVTAHCPKCGQPVQAEAVVQRAELVGEQPRIGWSGKLDPQGNPVREVIGRAELMVSFESATVPHACPNADADAYRAFPDWAPCAHCGGTKAHHHDADGTYVPEPALPDPSREERL